MSKSLIESVID